MPAETLHVVFCHIGIGALGHWGIGALGHWGIGALGHWGARALGRQGARDFGARSSALPPYPLSATIAIL
jgi:hypothetical protein